MATPTGSNWDKSLPLFEKEGLFLTLQEFEKLTLVKWQQYQDFSLEAFFYLAKKIPKMESSPSQKWLAAYFHEEILLEPPRLSIRWINPDLGWGVFAEERLPEMRYICCYLGLVRRHTKKDHKNSYCFEYPLSLEEPSPFTIDAREQGGVARYLNHSSKPNLTSSLVTIAGLNHILFYTTRAVAKGEQLCYDYGPAYWKKREAPQEL